MSPVGNWSDAASRRDRSPKPRVIWVFRAGASSCGHFGITPSEARQEAALPVLNDQRLTPVHPSFAEYAQQLGVVGQPS